MLLAIFISSPAQAWRGEVCSVTDGDTIVVLREDTGEKVKIRLYGIDAPETKSGRWDSQPYSRAATRHLKALLRDDDDDSTANEYVDVTILDMDLDKYGRTVGAVIALPDGVIVQENMLRAGMAWIDGRYCKRHFCKEWKGMEIEAKSRRVGLWREKEPTPPWEWRKSSTDE